MKTAILSLVLAGSIANAADTFLGTTIGVPWSSSCAAMTEKNCRVIGEAAADAQAYLVNPATAIGPRLENAMNLVRIQNPDSAFTTIQLAQIILEEVQIAKERAQ